MRRGLAWAAAVTVALHGALSAAPASAQPEGDRPDEDELFGGSDDDTDDAPSQAPQRPSTGDAEADRERDLFGGDDDGDARPGTGIDESLLVDPLTIGGQVYLRFVTQVQDGRALTDSVFSMPNLLDLYLDARPDPRVRAFVNGRLVFDPTVDEGDVDLVGQPIAQSRVLLDQMWVKTDIARRVFLTVGQERIKWGAARLWNPTDFLNATRRDPLTFFDERTGVPMLKVHVPFEELGWNAYGFALFDGADTLGQVGGAGRLEMVFGTAEVSLSAVAGDQRRGAIGADVSAGVGELDVYAEVALTHERGRKRWSGDFSLSPLTLPAERTLDDWFVQASGGFSWSFKPNEQDFMALGAEYFFNPLGYEDADLYPWLILNGAFEPFYLGRHYAAVFLLVPSPGDWNDVTFTTSTLGNLSDRTFVTRVDAAIQVHNRLRVEAYAQVHYGRAGGELRFELEIPDLGPLREQPDVTLPPPGRIPPPLMNLGLNLRVAI